MHTFSIYCYKVKNMLDKVVSLYYIKLRKYILIRMKIKMFTKTSNVEKSLLREILSGSYAPGSRIPSQHQLMRKYNVSRTTLLRALNKLTASGYLRGERGSGTYVNSLIRQEKFPLHLTVVGMHGEDYPFDQIFSGIGPVNWCTESEVPHYLEKLSEPGNAVIWLLPHPSAMLMMDFLQKRGVPQLLINRDYSEYEYIISDCKNSMREGLKLLASGKNAPALIAHRPGDLRPYLSNYIISFYEVCAEMGLTVDAELNFCRQYSPARSEFREIGKRLFGGRKPVREIAVLNFELVLPTLMSAAEYNMECGRDFRLMTIERAPEWKNFGGIIAICHDYQAYSQKVSDWLKNLENPGEKVPLRSQIPCKILMLPQNNIRS